MNKELKVKKTTYKVDGSTEPCFEVSGECAMVRIAPFYHFVGPDTILVTEYLDGEWNSEDEWTGDFDNLTEDGAVEIATRYSVYL